MVKIYIYLTATVDSDDDDDSDRMSAILQVENNTHKYFMTMVLFIAFSIYDNTHTHHKLKVIIIPFSDFRSDIIKLWLCAHLIHCVRIWMREWVAFSFRT